MRNLELSYEVAWKSKLIANTFRKPFRWTVALKNAPPLLSRRIF